MQNDSPGLCLRSGVEAPRLTEKDKFLLRGAELLFGHVIMTEEAQRPS